MTIKGLVFLMSLASCSAAPSITLGVEPPPAGDQSCIGVCGFEVEVRPADQSEVRINTVPVLSLTNCKMSSSVSLDGIDADQPFDVTVNGYDCLRHPRVRGTVHVESLRGSAPPTIALAGLQTPAPPIIVIHPADAFGGLASADVTSFALLHTTGKASVLEAMIDDVNRPYFATPDPLAFELTSSITVGDDLTVELGTSGKTPRLVVLRDPSDLFFDTTLSPHGPP